MTTEEWAKWTAKDIAEKYERSAFSTIETLISWIECSLLDIAHKAKQDEREKIEKIMGNADDEKLKEFARHCRDIYSPIKVKRGDIEPAHAESSDSEGKEI